jgi:hypothetical protein
MQRNRLARFGTDEYIVQSVDVVCGFGIRLPQEQFTGLVEVLVTHSGSMRHDISSQAGERSVARDHSDGTIVPQRARLL